MSCEYEVEEEAEEEKKNQKTFPQTFNINVKPININHSCVLSLDGAKLFDKQYSLLYENKRDILRHKIVNVIRWVNVR